MFAWSSVERDGRVRRVIPKLGLTPGEMIRAAWGLADREGVTVEVRWQTRHGLRTVLIVDRMTNIENLEGAFLARSDHDECHGP